MNRILFILSCLTIFGCNSHSKPAAETAETNATTKSLSSPVPFGGSWISASYLHDIKEHQSPRKAQVGSEDCYIHLPGSTLLPATMVINFHEGLTDLVVVNNNGAYQLWEKLNDTLSRALYTIEILSGDTIKIGGKPFVKINPERTDNQTRILEEILFAGAYKSKKGERVEFKSNGEVSGLGKYKFYSPIIDYFDAGLQIDQVGLSDTPGNMVFFGFKFKKDKLELYMLKCVTYDEGESRCVEVAFGKKTDELQKIK